MPALPAIGAWLDWIFESSLIWEMMTQPSSPLAGLDPDVLRPFAAEAGQFLRLLGNPHRLMILCALRSGEKSVSQLIAILEIRGSTVSQHLALLRRLHIVARRRTGQVIWYRIESTRAQRVLAVLSESRAA
jgi:DNA-binding transcriptional ArsR family regulator